MLNYQKLLQQTQLYFYSYNNSFLLETMSSPQLPPSSSYSLYLNRMLRLEVLREQHNDFRGNTVPSWAEKRGSVAKLCQHRLVRQTDRSGTMRHLICLNSSVLLDSLQRNEIRSYRLDWCAWLRVPDSWLRVPDSCLVFGLRNRTISVHSHSLPHLLFPPVSLSLWGHSEVIWLFAV